MRSITQPHFLLQLLALPTCFITVECLSCYTCESLEDCANPRIQLCSKNDECFTVAQNYDTKSNGLRKGCAPTCDRVNIAGKLCRTCDSELCNGKTGLGKAFEKPNPLPSRPLSGSRNAARRKKMNIPLMYLVLTIVLCILSFLTCN